MATTTAWIPKQTKTASASAGIATIDSGETATLPIPIGGLAVVRIGIPSTFTGTAITFTVQPYRPDDATAPTLSPPFRVLKDGVGNTVTKTVSTNTVFEVPELSGAYAFTIVSNASEGQSDAIEVSMFGANPSPFDASAVAGPFPSAFTRLATYTKAAIASAPGAWTTGNSPLTLFTVTGLVLCQVVGAITTGFTSTGATGTVAVGVTGNTAVLLPQTTADGSNFPTGAAWVDSSPTVKAESLQDATAAVLVYNTNIIGTIATNSMTAGGVILVCRWVPMSLGASVAGN